MVKENPCNKCCSYNKNKVCECNELSNYKHYKQGRADAIDEFVEWLNKHHNYGYCVIDMYVEEYKEQMSN